MTFCQWFWSNYYWIDVFALVSFPKIVLSIYRGIAAMQVLNNSIFGLFSSPMTSEVL